MAVIRKQHRRVSVQDANIVAMLSLKLLLLAFFILLSTMSSFEERRSRAVMESVSSTFHGLPRPTAGVSDSRAGVDSLPAAAALIERMKTLFRQSVPVVAMEESPDGGTLRLEMPAAALFVTDSPRLAPWRAVLLRRLVAILKDGARGVHEVHFVHSIPTGSTAGAGGSGSSEVDLAVRRAGTVARHLTRLGLAADRLSAGLWPRAERGHGAARIALDIDFHEAGGVPGRFRTTGDGG